MQKTVAGRLFIPGLERTYWLLHPHPIPHSDSWMRDDLATFYAALDTGAEPLTACHITVRGPFVIDPTHAGRKIALKESVEVEMNEEEESLDHINLFEMARKVCQK
jgi:hypothetical protein